MNTMIALILIFTSIKATRDMTLIAYTTENLIVNLINYQSILIVVKMTSKSDQIYNYSITFHQYSLIGATVGKAQSFPWATQTEHTAQKLKHGKYKSGFIIIILCGMVYIFITDIHVHIKLVKHAVMH